MSDEELDPEVQRDLWLREASTRDSTRSRPSEKHLGEWAPEKPVGKWKCRVPPCGNFVDVTESTMEYWAMWNRHLMAKGESPLDTKTILWCDSCREQLAKRRSELLRKRVTELAECIKQLKASKDPRQERELIKQIEAWRHPDLQGLLFSLEQSQKKNTKGPRGEL
jgi:hypothetical protein